LLDARERLEDVKLPMVEVFQTVEGEGTRAGFPTTFVRVYNCNLRCTWCDTPYSYAPAKPAYVASIREIVDEVKRYPNRHICLTGGEPLMHGEKSLLLIQALAEIPHVKDIHIETNGAIHLGPFHEFRETHPEAGPKVRFILDYKLPASGENDKMILENFDFLRETDEIKFVIADEEDFRVAADVLGKHVKRGIPLFSPVWETMKPDRLVELMLQHRLADVKLSLQLHKIIWHPDTRGV
jgi:7-carboxy-7-deazaguanine synthase